MIVPVSPVKYWKQSSGPEIKVSFLKFDEFVLKDNSFQMFIMKTLVSLRKKVF